MRDVSKMGALISSPTSHRAFAIGIMVGAMILIDAAMPGVGLLLIATILIVVFLRSQAYRLVVDLLNFAAGKKTKPADAKKGYA